MLSTVWLWFSSTKMGKWIIEAAVAIGTVVAIFLFGYVKGKDADERKVEKAKAEVAEARSRADAASAAQTATVSAVVAENSVPASPAPNSEKRDDLNTTD